MVIHEIDCSNEQKITSAHLEALQKLFIQHPEKTVFHTRTKNGYQRLYKIKNDLGIDEGIRLTRKIAKVQRNKLHNKKYPNDPKN